jgi:hypothetical protein
MAGIIAIASLLFVFAAFAGSPVDRASAVTLGLGYLVVGLVPAFLKHRHVRAQNALLVRCRLLLLQGSRAAAIGDQATAEKLLGRIAYYERSWRLGNSFAVRLSLAVWAIMLGFAACVAVRVPGYLIIHRGILENMNATLADAVSTSLVVSIPASIHALLGYLGNWTSPYMIENCRDRLWQILHGPRGIVVQSGDTVDGIPAFDGMTTHEIFGLGSDFSRRQLDQARRRLARALHPDRWHNAPHAERKAREEALKQVNVAYDVLRRSLH